MRGVCCRLAWRYAPRLAQGPGEGATLTSRKPIVLRDARSTEMPSDLTRHPEKCTPYPALGGSTDPRAARVLGQRSWGRSTSRSMPNLCRELG